MNQERRKHVRLPAEADNSSVTVLMEDDGGYKTENATLIDHSNGGLQIEMERDQFESGSVIFIRLYSGAPPQSRDISAKIIWKTEHNGKTRLGCEYFYSLYGIPYYF